MDAATILFLLALSDQAISMADKLKKLPYMSREEKIALIKEHGGVTDELIDNVQADLEMLRIEVKGG